MKRFVIYSRVSDVYEYKKVVGGRKDNNGDVVLDERSFGYFLSLSGVGFSVGVDDPQVSPGAPARIILEVEE